MGDTKLLPCPFCGGEPELYTIERHTHTGPASFMPDYGGGQFIECGCGIAMAIAPDKDAAAAWNTRPALLARQEGEDDSARMDWLCSGRQKKVERTLSDGWYRVYQDMASIMDPEVWYAMTDKFYPTAREAIDAAMKAARSGGGG